jgi:putative transposase
MGTGVPHRIGRHTHPQARAEEPAPKPERSGIDYLRLIEARDAGATARRITYSGLVESTEADQMPGQLQIPTTETAPVEENPS